MKLFLIQPGNLSAPVYFSLKSTLTGLNLILQASVKHFNTRTCSNYCNYLGLYLFRTAVAPSSKAHSSKA